MRPLRRRFWVESCAAVTSGIFLVLTLLSRSWIESVFGVDPDGGNGSLEWILVLTSFAVMVTLSLAARLELVRALSIPLQGLAIRQDKRAQSRGL